VFDGPPPSIAVIEDAQREIETVADFLRNAVADYIRPDEIGMFVRSPNEIGRARAAAERAGFVDQVAISVMHLAKGLEFRVVVVMACDQDVLPFEARIAEAADEGELDDIYRRSDS
jgi:superfamily I DNA/RNA helicase